jgi:hypothetical protein
MRTGGFGFDRQFGFGLPGRKRVSAAVADTLLTMLAQLEADSKLVCAWFLPLANPAQYLTLAGSDVTTWAAAYGTQKVNVTEATNKPTWDSTLFGGKGGLVFDGTNDCLTGTGNVANWPDASADLYMLAAARQDLAGSSGTFNYPFSYGDSTTDQRAISRRAVSSANEASAAAGSTFWNGTTQDFSGAHTVGAKFDIGGTSTTYLDGVADGTASTATAALTRTRTRIGSRTALTAGNFWSGAIVAAAILNSTATDQNFLDLEALMRARLS